MRTVIAKAGDTVELLAFREIGRQDDKTITAVLDANIGLADHGIFLPTGLRVQIPDMPREPAVKVLSRMQELWD